MKIFPENVSTYGNEIDQLFWIILAFVAVAFVISVFILLYPLYRNHHTRVARASSISGNDRRHFKWIVIPLVLLAASDFVILLAEHDTWEKIENVPAQTDVQCVVTGRQWNWIFTYPGPDGQLYTNDDVTIDEMNSTLHVPVNRNIVFDLRAKDVLHSFFVVNTRLKQDAIPGRTLKRWMNFTKTGTYDISCAEICGVLHARMRNFIKVESQAEYDAYLNTLYNSKAPVQ